jgi:threonine/homoserine/homoserine lactone efflux protein
MNEFILAGFSAVWLGILTSVSPCPLATNIAAISFIAKRVERPRYVLLSGVFYTIGRTIAYVALGALLVYSLISAPYLSNFLQTYMNKMLGPLLILVGMFLVGLIELKWPGGNIAGNMEGKVDRLGFWGAGVLGIVFALSFCPLSAALFFGTLLPLAVQNHSGILFPSLYGIGTAVPVVIFAIVIAVSAHSLGKAYAKVTMIERWARRITGVIFIIVGIYLSLIYIFHLPL